PRDPAPHARPGARDSQGEPSRDPAPSACRPQRVDTADLLASPRHDLPRRGVPETEEPIQAGGGRETKPDLSRADPRAAGTAVGCERERAQHRARDRHAIPEPLARTAKGKPERRIG